MKNENSNWNQEFSECRYVSHTGAFTKGGSKPCCDHPETVKLKGYDCFKRVIPYRTIYNDDMPNSREPKSIPKWCPLRKFEIESYCKISAV